MYRVVLSVALIALVPGCSLGTSSLSLGYDASRNGAKPSASALTGPRYQGSPGGELPSTGGTTQRTRTAKLDPRGAPPVVSDAAPSGSFEKAPKGALADRDYSKTVLDVERARQLVNDYRKQKGLRPLTLDADLTNAAKAHSRDLAKWDRISHFGSDGSNPWDRVKRAGYKARLAAENVGTGQTSIDEVFKGWQQSEGHNKNLLLPDAQHMGIALVTESNSEFRTFWTLVLGARM